MSTSLQPPHEPLPRQSAAPASGLRGRDGRGAGVLDSVVWSALTGPHRHLAETVGNAVRYRPEVSPFVAVADADDPGSWADLARLVGPGNAFALAGTAELPEGWATEYSGRGVQMVATALRDEPDPEAVPLGPADAPEMLDLVARTRPGPFAPHTVEMGAYYGIRRGGRLVAMAGERLRPPGWTEISAVCTDEEHRGQGLAARLVRHTAAGIRERGDTPFLHAAEVNTGAIRLYESIGFTLRREVRFHFLQVPAGALDGVG